MKETGIIRRIDDLGRIVIPKEIRRSLRIYEGDPLELFVDSDMIAFKKYSVMDAWKEPTKLYTKTLWQNFGVTALICDTNQIIAASPDFIAAKGMTVADEVSEQIRSGKEYFATEMDGEGFPSATERNLEFMRKVQVIVPVRDGVDVCGAVVLLFGTKTVANPEVLLNAARVIADILTSSAGA